MITVPCTADVYIDANGRPALEFRDANTRDLVFRIPMLPNAARRIGMALLDKAADSIAMEDKKPDEPKTPEPNPGA